MEPLPRTSLRENRRKIYSNHIDLNQMKYKNTPVTQSFPQLTISSNLIQVLFEKITMEPFHELRTILRLWPFFKPHSKFANIKYGILIASFTVCSLSSAWYLIFEAKDFNEYVDCFLMAVTGLTFLASLLIFKCRKTQLFGCFHDLETILSESEYCNLGIPGLHRV